MHETAIAQSLFEIILAETKKQNKKPLHARISCGTFSAVNDELLNFALEAACEKTLCEGIELTIEHKPIKTKCNKCFESFDFELSNPKCPHCGSDDYALLPDAPLILEEIEFESE